MPLQAIAVLTTVSVMGLIDSMKDGPYVAAPSEDHGAASSPEAAGGVSADGAAEVDRGLGLLVPLIYAPLLPTMVVLLRGRVRQAARWRGGCVRVRALHFRARDCGRGASS